MTQPIDYSALIQPAGPAYSQSQIVARSYYNNPIDSTAGRLAGNSRIVGDASADVQQRVIDILIEESRRAGLNDHQTAYVLAIARNESGFNPDAAAGTTSASGLGQFVNGTGSAYGLNNDNRWDARAQAIALVQEYQDMARLAKQRNEDEEYIYKYHHDGPSRDYGGLNEANRNVMPYLDQFENFVKAYPPSGAGNGTIPFDPSTSIAPGLIPALDRLNDLSRGYLNSPTQCIPIDLLNRFDFARNWVAPRRYDPLVLDLDGDGIETVGLNGASSVMFDHDVGGIKTATGWVNADDAFLVLDRNGNGVIDSGAELFGDSTHLSSGSVAADGFAALRDLDSNSDGVFDSQDTRYADIQLWRDLNQDGVSDAGELMSLVNAGIAAINLNPDAVPIDLGNGNQQKLGASFVRTNGSIGSIGSLDLAANAFYREFTTPVAVTTAAQALLGIQGSGAVRDLREAASLSAQLATAVAGINDSLSPTQMRAQVDLLISQWADTSAMQDGIAQAASIGMKVFYVTPAVNLGDIEAFSDLLGGTPVGWTGPTRTTADLSEAERLQYETLLVQQQGIDRLIGTLERFNAETFITVGASGVTGGLGTPITTLWDNANGSQVNGRAYVTLSQAQVNLLSQSFKVLEDAVYTNFTINTWVTPYLDQIGLTFDASTGFGFDFSGMQASLDALHQLDPAKAATTLLEIDAAAGDSLRKMGWRGLETLSSWVEGTFLNPSVQATLGDLGVLYGSGTLAGASGNNRILGFSGNDTITGGSGNDTIDGGAGDDVIADPNGGINVIYGGIGNDMLEGWSGADTYLFNRGDGQDTLVDIGPATQYTTTDQLVFGTGIAQSDLAMSRTGDDLVVKINDANNPAAMDQITIQSWFSSRTYQIESFAFADGSSLANTQISLYGTDGADTLNGWSDGGTILGLAGNDTITGGGGTNVVYGGDGNDTVAMGGVGVGMVYGEAGNDTVTMDAVQSGQMEGGDGNDLLIKADAYWTVYYPDLGYTQEYLAGYFDTSTTFVGGAGNDTLEGGSEADTYVFNRGDGQDTILDSGLGIHYTTTDQLVFGTGIAQSDLAMSRTGDDLVVKINDANNPAAMDQITIQNWFGSSVYQIESFVFADGTSIASAQVSQMGSVCYGTDGADTLNGWSNGSTILGLGGNDTITGGSGDETIDGGAGDDVITDPNGGTNVVYGGDGNDTVAMGGVGVGMVYGEAGNDTVTMDVVQSGQMEGGDGNDLLIKADAYWTVYYPDLGYTQEYLAGYFDTSTTFVGGAGNDTLEGGSEADTYVFNRGDGQDTILDSGLGIHYTTTDQLTFGQGSTGTDSINSDQLWFRHVGNNLEVSIIGKSESVTVENWYSDSAYHLERFKTTDNKLLLDTRVESLVQAMAAFAPPASGQTTLPQNYQDALAPVIAANWQ